MNFWKWKNKNEEGTKTIKINTEMFITSNHIKFLKNYDKNFEHWQAQPKNGRSTEQKMNCCKKHNKLLHCKTSVLMHGTAYKKYNNKKRQRNKTRVTKERRRNSWKTLICTTLISWSRKLLLTALLEFNLKFDHRFNKSIIPAKLWCSHTGSSALTNIKNKRYVRIRARRIF